ncbi:MAG: hypothetical protein AB8B55_14500 [Mariniblastus sp.]
MSYVLWGRWPDQQHKERGVENVVVNRKSKFYFACYLFNAPKTLGGGRLEPMFAMGALQIGFWAFISAAENSSVGEFSNLSGGCALHD